MTPRLLRIRMRDSLTFFSYSTVSTGITSERKLSPSTTVESSSKGVAARKTKRRAVQPSQQIFEPLDSHGVIELLARQGTKPSRIQSLTSKISRLDTKPGQRVQVCPTLGYTEAFNFSLGHVACLYDLQETVQKTAKHRSRRKQKPIGKEGNRTRTSKSDGKKWN